LEVSEIKVRNVQASNDPGTGDRPGNTVSNMSQLEEDVWSASGYQRLGNAMR
jgi:hypothetical protein